MRAADDDLEAALLAAAREHDCIDDGHVITSWIIVGTTVGPRVDSSSYFRMYSGGSMASHLSLGLLDVAATMERDWLTSPASDGDDEDDP